MKKKLSKPDLWDWFMNIHARGPMWTRTRNVVFGDPYAPKTLDELEQAVCNGKYKRLIGAGEKGAEWLRRKIWESREKKT